MNTVILTWNPEISSFKMSDYLEGMKRFDEFHLNWSVWDFNHIYKGDHFYLVRVGKGNTGVVMSGVCLCNPYEGENWKEADRPCPTFYIDLDIEWMINPDNGLVLSTKLLTEAIPGFDWTGGHSGRVLNIAEANILAKLWDKHLNENVSKVENTELVRHQTCPKLDYVIEGIADSVRNKIDGVEILDKYYGYQTGNLHDAEVKRINYDMEDNSIELVVQPCNSNDYLKFRFTQIFSVEWDTTQFCMYVAVSRIYRELNSLVAEFDNVYFSVCCKHLEVSLVSFIYD